jgi:uncharacterized membrane protein YagU involved in acid resistance
MKEAKLHNSSIATDIAVGLAAGLAATLVTERIQMALWKLTPGKTRDVENQVRPGPPPKMAAKKLAEAVGAHPNDKQTRLLSKALHYGLGVAWGPLYGLLRRYSGMSRFGAGVITGMSMSVIVDEALSPALGFTAPNRDYPPAAHVRGVVAHLAFGLVAAAAAESLYRLAGPRRSAG